MKAWKLTSYGNFSKGIQKMDVPTPVPADDEVLIEVHAAALNPVDFKIAQGQLRMVMRLKMPAALGYDCSGVVHQVGKDVTHLKPGDEIFCCAPTVAPGTLAEWVTIKAHVVMAKPTNLSFAEAASTPLAGLTTLSCMDAIRLKAQEKILIHAGSGGVGSLAIQYARQLGAEVMTTTGTSNLSWVKRLGADRVIDYKTQDYKAVVPPLDVVFDTLGAPFTSEAFPLLVPGGRLVSIAGRKLDKETMQQLGLPKILQWFLQWQLRPIKKRCEKYQVQYRFVLNEPEPKKLARLKQLLEEKKIKPVINHIFSFEEVIPAFEMQQSGRSKGKNVILIKS
ncbi:MAG: NADP-dependent oxidoreductase [Owenweeksia sp.]|nr:NADP-dependent oxidoreductase [Owenweeksia sp.]